MDLPERLVKKLSDEKTIGIGIVGAGFARTTQIPGFLNCKGARVVAITSRHRENAESVAREFGIALDRGKAVLCEKPMAMNADEAKRMTERAQEAGVLALVDHELRFLSSRRKMRAMLAESAIGVVRHCNYVFRSDYRGVLERAWDWWSDERMGGGTLGAIGSHVVDSFRWMLGAEVSEVCGMLSTHVAERPEKGRASASSASHSGGEPSTRDGVTMRRVTTDDEAKLMFRFTESPLTKNTTGMASVSVVESGKHLNQLEVYGSKGALMVEETGELWRSPAGSGAWQSVQVERDPIAPGMRDGSWSRGFTAFASAIVTALRKGESTVTGAASFEDGYRVQLILDAARASNKSGCWKEI
jgi:predicted dehydrogenase